MVHDRLVRRTRDLATQLAGSDPARFTAGPGAEALDTLLQSAADLAARAGRPGPGLYRTRR